MCRPWHPPSLLPSLFSQPQASQSALCFVVVVAGTGQSFKVSRLVDPLHSFRFIHSLKSNLHNLTWWLRLFLLPVRQPQTRVHLPCSRHHLSYCCTPSTWACPAATLITTFAATCIIICIHFQSVRQSFSLTRSPSLSLTLFQSVSQSVAQLLSQSVVQSTLPCRLPSLLACAVYTHLICHPPPAWLDSIFFEYNSQPAKEGEGKKLTLMDFGTYTED